MADSVLSGTRVSLARVLDALGDTFLELVAGRVADADDLGGIEVFDHSGAELPLRAIVFGIGVQDADALHHMLRELGDRGAAALIVRAPVPMTSATERVVRESGVVLLALTYGASWSRLAAMLRTLLYPTRMASRGAAVGGLPSGDLFALANAIAALVDAPITIEDRNLNVLAFSGRQEEADESRIETILGRQVPERFASALEERGVLDQVYSSNTPVVVEPEQFDSAEVAIPRAVVAVRAGDEILGSIWAVATEPLDRKRADALADAAKVASLHLLRVRAGADVDRRFVADLIATAMEGGPSGPEALSKLGLLGRTLVVTALGVLNGRSELANPSRITASNHRVADALALHMSTVAPGSAVGQLGDVTYCLVPVTGTVDTALDKVATLSLDFLTRTGSKFSTAIGVGPVACDPSQLSRSRMGADRALRVLTTKGRSGKVAKLSDVVTDALLLELGDIAAARGDVHDGPIARLAAHDENHSSELVHTLRCWLDCFGDVAEAAALAYVHPNTFRYRLKRLVEVSGIDLKSADDRFAAMLQFRLPLHPVEP